MKRKWNWLDTLIVCIAVVLIAGVCFFLFRPADTELSANPEMDYYLTFETEKAKVGTFDKLKVGDVVYVISDDKEFGVIESVESLPYQAAVFNETTKQFDLAESDDHIFSRIVVKTTGYKNDKGAVFAQNRSVIYDDEWHLETDTYRFNGYVTGIKEVEVSK